MRIPARLDLGPYTLHLDVLAARLIRHRRRIRRWSIGFFTLVSTLVLATLAWTLLPWFHGTGTVILNLNAAPSPDAASGLVNDDPDDPNDPVVVTINGQPVATGIDRITLRSGQHTLTAQRANRFPVTLTFTVTQAQTTTLTLPPLRPIPIVQPVSLPSPDATWHAMAQDVSGGWRVQAQLPTPRTATMGQPGWGPSPSMAEPSLRTILHLDRNGLNRLSLFDAYPVADEIIIPGSGDALGRNSGNGGNHSHRFWATWEPSPSLFTQGSTGALFIDTPMTDNGTANEIANGTANGTQVISTTQPVRGLWWAPQGRALLVAQSHEQGQRLWLFIPHHGRSSPGAEPERQAAIPPPAPGSTAPVPSPAPIPDPIPVPIPIAGNVQSVHWHPDGQAVVVVISADDPPSAPLPPATLPTPTPTPTPPTHTPLHLERDPPLTFPTRSAILIRFIDDADERGAQVAVTRLQAPPNLASGAVLLAWAASSASASPEHSQEQAWELWWGADTGLGLALDRITLRDGSSVRMGSLPRAIVALTVRPDTSVRLLLIQPEGSLAVVRWPSLEPIFTLPTIQVPPGGALRPGGLWAGDDLLVATSATTLWHVQVEPEALQP